MADLVEYVPIGDNDGDDNGQRWTDTLEEHRAALTVAANDHEVRVGELETEQAQQAGQIELLQEGIGAPTDTGVATLLTTDGTATNAALAEQSRAAASVETVAREEPLRTWRVAAADAATTGADVLLLGDSITEGATSSVPWWVALREQVRSAAQPATIRGGFGYYGGGSHAPRYYMTGTWDYANVGLGARSRTGAVGASVGFSVATSSFDIVYSRTPGGGALDIKIDGVAAGSVNTSGAAASGLKQRFTAPRAGSHLVDVTVSGAAATLEGVTWFDGDEAAGLRFWNAGHASWGASHMAANTAWPASLPAIGNLKAAVIALGVNDFVAGRTPAQFEADLETLIGQIRTAVSPDPSIVLVGYFHIGNSGRTAAEWEAYRATYRKVAAEQGATFVDCTDLFGPYDGGDVTRGGLLVADGVHPTNAGHRIIADAVAKVLAPGNAAPLSPGAVTADIAANRGAGGLLDSSAIALTGTPDLTAYAGRTLPATLTGDVVLTTANMPPSRRGVAVHLRLLVAQDATGGRRVLVSGSGWISLGDGNTVNLAPNSYTLIDLWTSGNGTWFFAPIRTGRALPMRSYPTILAGPLVLSGVNLMDLRLTLTGNVTYATSAAPAIPAGMSATQRVTFIQDATGGRTLTLSGFLGPGVVLSTAAGAKDLVEFYYDGVDWWARKVS